MKFISFLRGFLACLLFPLNSLAQSTETNEDLLENLTGEASMWELTPEIYESTYAAMRADWLDATKKKSRMNFADNRLMGGKQFFMGGKLQVLEIISDFGEVGLSRVQASLYNRGDGGSLSPDAFKERIRISQEVISAKVGNAGEEKAKAAGAVLTKGWIWKTPATHYLLESSIKRQQGEDRPEFLRLVMIPATSVAKVAIGSSGGNALKTKATLSALKNNVTKNDTGDVYINNVPMVDQGQKGYCVVATAERVMRYYGAEVDQHELAQMADSSASGGTSTDKMEESLDRIDSKFNLRLKRIMPWTSRGYLEIIKEYNRAARSTKAREISSQEAYNVGLAYEQMDAETLKKSRTSGASMDKYKKLVRASIDAGVPLMWTVQLGLFQEGNLPQSGGGHMRLIIGYNDTTNETIFSDSWGAGHELKRLGSEEAWTITTALYSMEPKVK